MKVLAKYASEKISGGGIHAADDISAKKKTQKEYQHISENIKPAEIFNSQPLQRTSSDL